MGFSTKECAWKHTTVKVLGRTLVGIQGFEFKKNIDKEALYGAGDEPIDIQSGNKSYTGNLELLKFEVDMLDDAAYKAGYTGGIIDVPHEAIFITCVYKKEKNDPKRTLTATGVAFTESTFGMKQNGKNTPVTLPFIAMRIV
jgi:hypothetical protein